MSTAPKPLPLGEVGVRTLYTVAISVAVYPKQDSGGQVASVWGSACTILDAVAQWGPFSKVHQPKKTIGCRLFFFPWKSTGHLSGRFFLPSAIMVPMAPRKCPIAKPLLSRWKSPNAPYPEFHGHRPPCVCLFVCLFVCLLVCLFACLLACLF